MLKYSLLLAILASAISSAQADQVQPLGSTIVDVAHGTVTFNFANNALSKTNSNWATSGQFANDGPFTSLAVSASGHQRLAVPATVSATEAGLGVYGPNDNKSLSNRTTAGVNYLAAERAEALVFTFGTEVTLNDVRLANFGPSSKGLVFAMNAAGWIVGSAELTGTGLSKPLKAQIFRITGYASPSNNFLVSSVSIGQRIKQPAVKSLGRFSSPSAAIFSLNDSRPRLFPTKTSIPQMLSTGTQNLTWDGRVLLDFAGRYDMEKWVLKAYIPEKIRRNDAISGTNMSLEEALDTTQFLEDSSSAPVYLERPLSKEPRIESRAAVAIVPHARRKGDNPYRSTQGGFKSDAGSFKTYEATLYFSAKMADGSTGGLGFRHAKIIISNPDTIDAKVYSARYTSDFQWLSTISGQRIRCIEPSVTVDGRLLMCNGHTINDGRIGTIVYSWNPKPGGADGWTAPSDLANLYHVDRDKEVAGLPFYKRYPIAENPLHDFKGEVYTPNRKFMGAYPWLSHDGTELFYAAARNSKNHIATRSAISVVGRWTGWLARHIDGPINPNRLELRHSHNSPGAFTTMWAPYQNTDDLKIPYSVRGPSFPILGNGRYNEVGFDDFLDGNYVLYLSMNEAISPSERLHITNITPDTSGNFNNATLVNAKFPQEAGLGDVSIGRYGQAIQFESGHYLGVQKNSSLDTFRDGITVEFWLKGNIPTSGEASLFNLENGLNFSLVEGGLKARFFDIKGTVSEVTAAINLGTDWNHIAVAYGPLSRQAGIYINGLLANEVNMPNFGQMQAGGAVTVGPKYSSTLVKLIIDELKVSNVRRTPWEIAYSAKADTRISPDPDLLAKVPSHLKTARFNVTNAKYHGVNAERLGQRLFNDKALSHNNATSCATCHAGPGNAFTDGKATSFVSEPLGVAARNSPMLLNRAFSSLQGWAGTARSLGSFSAVPMNASHELNLPLDQLVKKLARDPSYVAEFASAFNKQAPNSTNVQAALESHMAVQFSAKSPIDEVLAGNYSSAGDVVLRGMALFNNKARCVACHSGVNFTDESFRGTGLASNADFGRALLTRRDRDFKLFKVPSLRAVNKTGPYMHDGSLPTLEAVVRAYNAGAPNIPTRDSDIRPLQLTEAEIKDLLAFLNAL